MKKATYLFFFLTTCCSFSQEMIKTVNLNLSGNTKVFQVIEEDKKQVSLFFCEKKKIRPIRFDNSFNIIDSISVDRPSSDFDDIVGYSLSENKYYAYWSNSNNKEILAQCFDFNSKKVSNKSFSLTFDKEKPIKRITIDNVFYLITIIKNSSILNFYVFKNGNLDKKTVDLSNKKFLDVDNKAVPLWNLVSSSTAFEPPFSFQMIATDTPPSLAFSANKRKLYVVGNTVVFSMDVHKKFTQTFTINLADFSATQKVYSQPYFEEGRPVINDNQETLYVPESANSFLIKDAMIQIRTVSDVVKISVKNLEGEELKSFKINDSEDISFKNSDIYQENGSVKSLRVLDKSNQFVRKMGNLNSSLSVYKSNEKTYMVIGGVSLPQENGVMIGGMIGGFTGALIGSALSSSYSMNNLNSYKNRKVVYINCLFDDNFNHIDGSVKKTAFDELRGFAESQDDLTSATVFKLNSNLYFGGYDIKKRTYSFYKFND